MLLSDICSCFRLECRVDGDPVPSVTWELDGQTIEPEEGDIRYENGVASLVLEDAMPEDSGEYTCIATNSEGKATCSCRVTVQGRWSRVDDLYAFCQSQSNILFLYRSEKNRTCEADYDENRAFVSCRAWWHHNQRGRRYFVVLSCGRKPPSYSEFKELVCKLIKLVASHLNTIMSPYSCSCLIKRKKSCFSR